MLMIFQPKYLLCLGNHILNISLKLRNAIAYFDNILPRVEVILKSNELHQGHLAPDAPDGGVGARAAGRAIGDRGSSKARVI